MPLNINLIFGQSCKVTNCSLFQLVNSSKTQSYTNTANNVKTFIQHIDGDIKSQFDVTVVFKMYVSITELGNNKLKIGDKFTENGIEYKIIESEFKDYNKMYQPFYQLLVEKMEI